MALQKAFRLKRDHVLDRLSKMGLPVAIPPQATFYIWLDLSALPEPLNNGLVFFEELLKVRPATISERDKLMVFRRKLSAFQDCSSISTLPSEYVLMLCL